MNKKMTWLLGILFILFGCDQSKTSGKENISKTTEERIVIGSLESEGMDSVQISKMTKAITDQSYPNIHSVLIARNGKLVYENYFPGKDEILGQSIGLIKHNKDSLHDIRSVSKSIVSACIGIAISQGKIKNEDQKIWDFFPEYNDLNTGEKSNITIKHLLTMSSGLEWNEMIPYTDPANSEVRMDYSPDPVKFVLSQKSVTAPGTIWNYNGGGTQILAAIIKKVTGVETDEYAREYIFKPLGITQFFWIKFPSTQIPIAASGLRLRSRDMLKFGLLYMNKGIWNERQILSEAWVRDSHKSYINRGDSATGSGGYGYQFWIWKDTINNKPINIVAAIGNGDQRIFFDHENDLLVVTTAGNYNKWDIKNNADALVRNYIYPSFIK